MTRPTNNAPSLDDSFASWLADNDEAVSRVAESGEVPVGSRAADSGVSRGDASGSSSSRESLAAAALRGHSPSARALVNASDVVVGVAATAPVPSPPGPALKDRILRTAAITARSKVAPEMPIVSSPNEAVGVIHKKSEDPRRLQLIDALGARGAALAGARELSTDRALEHLLEQLWPFLGFDVVFVSAVAGPDTIHRVHRGFPPEMGKMDVVPRELSFCTHTVSAAEPVVVEDAGREAFFRRSLLVQKFGARSYLGVPLFSRAGGETVALGALCGISLTPRTISQEDVELTSCF
ncbi:MAG: GAF domain-containing protein, partial [Myxococcales bacterium]|nr:GAF domain-containing protein [Myxococcales bacterium]